MSAQNRYFEAIHEGLSLGEYHAIWPPGKPVTLGAIGAMKGRVFDPRGHLQDYAAVDQDAVDPQPDGLTYGHGEGIDVAVQVAGATGPVTAALTDVALSLKITFHKKDQVALRAVGTSYVRVRDTRRFAESVLSAFAQNAVEYGDVFVNGMITATSGAVAVSGSDGASVELSGRGDVAPGGVVGLLSLKSGISIANSTKTELSIPMSDGFVLAARLVSLDKKGVFKVRPVVRDLATFDDDEEFDREYDLTFEEHATNPR